VVKSDRDLECRIDGLGARIAEENVIERVRRQPRNTIGDLECSRMRELERRSIVQPGRLLLDGLNNGFPIVTRVRAP
jgi:hypothetical protein